VTVHASVDTAFRSVVMSLSAGPFDAGAKDDGAMPLYTANDGARVLALEFAQVRHSTARRGTVCALAVFLRPNAACQAL
jgi:hypothetical protein